MFPESENTHSVWRICFFWCVLLTLFTMASLLMALCLLNKIRAKSSPPHIIVIIADDLGWASVGFHDDEVKTPFIDNLAMNESLILSRHYVYKFCSPTRSSFLSGRLPLHINEQNREIWQPGGGIHLGMYTLPQILKLSETANYHTHQFGMIPFLQISEHFYKSMARQMAWWNVKHCLFTNEQRL